MKHFYMVLFCIFSVIFLSTTSFLIGQTGTIRGKILDYETGKAVGYAYILNFSSNTSTYSNSGGDFNLSAQPGDTLVLYAVGYYYMKTIVDRTILNAKQVSSFIMKGQAYELTEARIMGLGTYEEFKQDFISLDKPKTKTEVINQNLATISQIEGKEAYDQALASGRLKIPAGIGVGILTPEERQYIMLAKIKEREKIRDQVYRKFNPMVVKEVTGLTNDDVIIEFMVFCDFTDPYLLNVNEYTLREVIAVMYEKFKSKKEEMKNMQNRIDQTTSDYWLIS
jgi:hypothetical protein